MSIRSRKTVSSQVRGRRQRNDCHQLRQIVSFNFGKGYFYLRILILHEMYGLQEEARGRLLASLKATDTKPWFVLSRLQLACLTWPPAPPFEAQERREFIRLKVTAEYKRGGKEIWGRFFRSFCTKMIVDPKLKTHFLRHTGARATDLSLSLCRQITSYTFWGEWTSQENKPHTHFAPKKKKKVCVGQYNLVAKIYSVTRLHF